MVIIMHCHGNLPCTIIQVYYFSRHEGMFNSIFMYASVNGFIYFCRKSESRVFPQSVPITVPNIISFILANVESNMKLKIMWTICSQTTVNMGIHVMCSVLVRYDSFFPVR